MRTVQAEFTRYAAVNSKVPADVRATVDKATEAGRACGH